MSKSPKITVTDPTKSAVVQWKQTWNGATNTDTLGPGQSKSYTNIYDAQVKPLAPAMTVDLTVEDLGTTGFTVTDNIQYAVSPGDSPLALTAHGEGYSYVGI